MIQISEFLEIPPYSLSRKDKESLINPVLSDLSLHHYTNCGLYRKMMDGIGFNPYSGCSYHHLPFLPVRLFKLFDLFSVPKEEIVKTMTSSGTTGQSVSKIYLDKLTSSNQTRSLTKIVSSFIGTHRVPMIIIDSESVLKDRNLFSARGAGILGFSLFGSKKIYALNENMELNINQLIAFVNEYKDSRILLFGFTFMIYHHFYKMLVKNEIKLDLSNAVLIHGGGWKKLISEAISSQDFYKKLNDVCSINSVHDYYGMVEQTGTIYMECEYRHLHVPAFSDVIIRRPKDFSIADIGEPGIIQVISILPYSYPGHSILTEDEGILLGEDDCKCGRLGKYFKINGRLKSAELRGCSDVYGANAI